MVTEKHFEFTKQKNADLRLSSVISQRYTDVPKTQKVPQNSRCQNYDKRKVPKLGTSNIRRHIT